MSKRRKFILTSILLSLGFVAIQFLSDQNRFWAIALLGLATFFLFFWSLYETLNKDMTLVTLILPIIFTFGVGTFWFLLPANTFVRIPIIIFYGMGIYVLCLTMNIFTVSANRTIALFRAARGVGFVVSLLTGFFIYDAVLSLKAEIFIFIPLVFITSFLLFLPGYWSTTLEKKFDKKLLDLSLISSFLVSQVSLILFFWPVTVVVGSIFLTVMLYLFLGLGQAYLEEKLFPQVIKEYLFIGIIVFLAMLSATHWGI